MFEDISGDFQETRIVPLSPDQVQALDADEWEAQLGEFCRELRKKYMEDGENPKSVREPLGFQLSRPAS